MLKVGVSTDLLTSRLKAVYKLILFFNQPNSSSLLMMLAF